MNLLQRFIEFAAAFEKAYVDDDWTRLEPFLTEDAVYEVTGGPPLGGRWTGRQAVLTQLKASVDGLDRHFDERKTELLGAPVAADDTVTFDWRGTYTLAGKPDLVFGGTERVEFEGDRIRFFTDLVTDEDAQRVYAYQAEHLSD
ncbi:MAG: nuclear transport factor 2 family protein [Myxococcota bacterium]